MNDAGLENEIVSAAKDGALSRLKQCFSRRSKAEIKSLVSTTVGGCTPLAVACQNGYLNVVRYLVLRCLADINQVCSVCVGNELVESASPLWCSCQGGHISVVKFLLEKGACVNSVTSSGSTALRAACFDGHLQVVILLVRYGADIEIANHHKHTCLMISCFRNHSGVVKYLLESGAQVDRITVKGSTALHDSAEGGSLETTRLLLQYEAVFQKDCYGMTPLLAAAACGNIAIVEYLCSLASHVSKQQTIDAYELLGATIIDKRCDLIGAIRYWKFALALRFEDDTKPLHKPKDKTARSVYNFHTEVLSNEDIDNLLNDPDKLRIQALIVRERILGVSHPDTLYYIRHRGAIYADMGLYTRCLRLWMYALRVQHYTLEPLSALTLSAIVSFIELFSCLRYSRKLKRYVTEVFKVTVVEIMRYISTSSSSLTHTSSTSFTFTHFLHVAMDLYYLLYSLENCYPSVNNHHTVHRCRSLINTTSQHRNQQSSQHKVGFGAELNNAQTDSIDVTACATSTDSNQSTASSTTTTAVCDNNSQMFVCDCFADIQQAVALNGTSGSAELADMQCSAARHTDIHGWECMLYQLLLVCPRTLGGKSPLHLAIEDCVSAECIRTLLVCGSNPNSSDIYGNTPMHVLAEAPLSSKQKCSILRQLVAFGAHVDCRNYGGYTFLELCNQHDRDYDSDNGECDRDDGTRGSKLEMRLLVHRMVSLQCLAAACVHRVYSSHMNTIPSHLYQFVTAH